MGDKLRPEKSNRSLGELRGSLQDRLAALDGKPVLSGELKAIFDDLIVYHDSIMEREEVMQGALVNLVDDMSQTSREYAETGKRLEAIMAAATDVAFVVFKSEAPNTILEFSAGASKVFGHDRIDAVGRSISMLCPEPEELAEGEESPCTSGARAGTRAVMRRKSGEIFPALHSAYPLLDQTGRVPAMLMIALDMTRQEEAARAKSDFIANISHEIRTPLNALLGILQILEEEDLGVEFNELISHSSEAGQGLLALLNDILDFTVVEARALALDEQDFELRELVAHVAAPYRLEATNKGLVLDSVVHASLPARLHGDSRRLRQVLFHVLANAVKFTDKGGVKLEVAHGEDGAPDGRMNIRFTISDTGIGMTDEQMEHIFEPFHQADGSRTRRHGGTGIGLALVHEFIAVMGGTVAVKSTPDEGTVFSFTVSLAGQSQEDL